MAISIHDTYIPKDCIANLSHPFRCHLFRRMENVLSRRHQGSGMGLFITKALVERGQGGGEAGRPAVHRRTLMNKERAKAKYWRDKMAAADVNDVRDLPRRGN
jgi:signal transduction histidine kinase